MASRGGEVGRCIAHGLGFDSRICHWSFFWHNTSGRTVSQGSTKTLTRMNIWNISWRVKWPLLGVDKLTKFISQLS